MPTRKPIRSSLLPPPPSSSIQYSALSARDDDDNWDNDDYTFDTMSSTPDHPTLSRQDSPVEIEVSSSFVYAQNGSFDARTN